MRTLIARSVLALLATAVFSSSAWAAAIPIGSLYWQVTETDDQGAPTAGYFSVVNQTGANEQSPDFPVSTQVTFNADLNLEVDFDDASSANVGLGDMTSPDGGLSWDSAIFNLGPNPVFAQLTGTIAPLVINVSGMGLFNVIGGIFTVPGALGDGVNPLLDFDFAIIYVNAEPINGTPVPEPATLLLLGVGIAGTFARRRSLATRR